MAEIFISYARDEQARAEEILRALEALSVSVFFDVDRLEVGDAWADVINREIEAATVVVALWSPHALSRAWIRKECAKAQARGVLMPALLEPVSDLDMPVQFSDLQKVNLSDWHGESDHAEWRKLVRGLAKALKRNDLLAAQIATLKEEKQTARVAAELEAAQKELAGLRKSKGGVKPAFVAAGVAITLVIAAAAAWWGVGEMLHRERVGTVRALEKVVTPEVLTSTVTGCEGGNAAACRMLGFWHSKGVGMATNKKQAAQYYRIACVGGDYGGCRNLGVIYANGDGVAKSREQSQIYYAKACDLGDVLACIWLRAPQPGRAQK